MATTPPYGPVYVCLDAGLQEQKLDRSVAIPDPAASVAPARAVGVRGAGRGTGRSDRRGEEAAVPVRARLAQQEAWDRRVALVEHRGRCGADVDPRALGVSDRSSAACRAAVLLAQPEGQGAGARLPTSSSASTGSICNGLLLQISTKTADTAAKIAHVSLDHALHNGWSMDYFSLPPVDLPVDGRCRTCLIAQLLPGSAKAVWASGRPRAAPARARWRRPNIRRRARPRSCRATSRWRWRRSEARASSAWRIPRSAGRAMSTPSAIRSTSSATTAARVSPRVRASRSAFRSP